MCDDEIHQGLTYDPGLSRRAFGLAAGAGAALASSAALAQAEVVETDVTVSTPDGMADAVLFRPAKGTHPAVLIWTDILGLRPVFRDMGRRLASQGYVVLVPNPYYRKLKAPVVGPDFDLNKPESRGVVMPLMQSLTPEGTTSDGRAFLAYLDAQPGTDKRAKAGVQGYCMGGPLAFRTAAAVPERIAALATFHGGSLVTAAPTSPHLLIPQMKCEALVDIADNDDKREPTGKDTLRAAFADAHRPAKVQVFDGCNHGWCVRGSAVYNAAGAERAWDELSKLYGRALA